MFKYTTRKTLFALTFVLSLLLSACSAPSQILPPPQVHLPVYGCGGALTGPDTVVTAAHCVDKLFVPVQLPLGRMAIGTVTAFDEARDWAELRLDGEYIYPWYAEFREPAHGDTAYVMGRCDLRKLRTFDATFIGLQQPGVTPQGVDGGAWPHWVLLSGQVSCPGDSGSPYWSVEPEGDVWHFMGVGSMYRSIGTYIPVLGTGMKWDMGVVTLTAEPRE